MGWIIERSKMEEARLAVSRQAAELFLKQGLDATSGDDIAKACGISKRTVWRYFRSKEACVEPLLRLAGLRFAEHLLKWPRQLSIEEYLRFTMLSFVEDDDAMRDAVAAVRIIALLPKEPALRSAWLMACSEAEEQMIRVIAARTGRSHQEFEVRLCAAAIVSALRLVDEEISLAVIHDRQHIELPEATDRMAAAIRAASILPICDPVA